MIHRALGSDTLCYEGRNTDFIDLNVNFTLTVAKAAAILNVFPTFLRP